MSVKSTEGQGSEFEIRLPLGEAYTQKALEQEIISLRRGLRILIAEDHIDTAMMSAAILESEGHSVEIAGDGPSAVGKALSMKPDIILLDIGLPGFNGYEVAKKVRGSGLSESLIVAVTGYGQEQDIIRAHNAGIDEHLLKPVDYDKLLPLLTRYEEKKRPHAAFDA